MSPYEHFAAVPGDLFRGVACVLRQLEALRPMVDRVGGVGVANLNVEDGANVPIRPGQRHQDGGVICAELLGARTC